MNEIHLVEGDCTVSNPSNRLRLNMRFYEYVISWYYKIEDSLISLQ